MNYAKVIPGGFGTAFTLAASSFLIFKIYATETKQQVFHFIIIQALLDVAIDISQFLLFFPELSHLSTGIQIFNISCVNSALVAIMCFAYIDYRNARRRRKFPTAIYYIVWALLTAITPIILILVQDSRTLYLCQIILTLVAYFLIAFYYCKVSAVKTTAILTFNWMFFFNILAGILFFRFSQFDTLTTIFEIVLQFFGIVNAIFYYRWMQQSNTSTKQISTRESYANVEPFLQVDTR